MSAQPRDLGISVVDANADHVPNASVFLIEKDGRRTRCLEKNQNYVCLGLPDIGSIIEVFAAGFAVSRNTLTEKDLLLPGLRIVLELPQSASLGSVVINITRAPTKIGESPESVVALGREGIETSAAATLDDILRQIPGFSLFRRTSGQNANPTAQGVSLRGTGASGASRSLVMLDGVPLNDPFGGWVQWNRVAPISVETVEVLRGGASNLYPSSALSGAIDLRTRKPANGPTISGEIFGGSSKTFGVSVFSGAKIRQWILTASGGHFQTRGYIPVAAADRGPVDSFAGVRSSNLTALFQRSFDRSFTLFFRPVYFQEARTNGTSAQVNRTTSRNFVLGGDAELFPVNTVKNGRISWRIYGGTQVYDQSFSAVNSNRTSEALTRIQRSPSQNIGISASVAGSIRQHFITTGVDLREVRGASDELGIVNGTATSRSGSGGRERTFGISVKDVFTLSDRLILSGSIRVDRWNNFRALSATLNTISGIGSSTVFPDRGEEALSPQFSVRWQATDRIAVHGVASRSFRSPTLNELYRGFRLGNVVTNANENLRAERAANFETGASFFGKTFGIRSSYFHSIIDRGIANISVSSTPNLITRQRQNAGRINVCGIEVDLSFTRGNLSLNSGYLLLDSRITTVGTDTQPSGKFVPQIPRHQFTFQARYSKERWQAAAQFRSSGKQFDDDLNLFRLEPYAQLDLFYSRRIKYKAAFFAAIENAFDSRYSTGRTPLRTITAPLTIRAGLRWN
ncbi:TonB-dependent receptor [Leptolyngbya sp. 7M]|uniref:TonB-dependent receptor n=1 Tax=Leptolyngbya sp. 7M TaxID=2812896 RepID=UPI001B8B5138|nr:TonB-dependent receptor [Leptolyngbya sp. 7M]QYO67278.1 TonB-dependent receptor [Leptolyngbya sp. 7M]